MKKFKKLRTLIERMKSLNVDDMMYEILQDKYIQERIIEYNHEQLERGQDIDGSSLSSRNPYSVRYAKLKGQTTVDLKVSGAFYRTFRVKVFKGGFDVVADTDLYGVDFLKKYGNILGLNDKNTQRLEELLKPYIIEYIKNYLTKDL